jgi:hypothetical protein
MSAWYTSRKRAPLSSPAEKVTPTGPALARNFSHFLISSYKTLIYSSPIFAGSSGEYLLSSGLKNRS